MFILILMKEDVAKVAHEYLIETIQYNGGETKLYKPTSKTKFTHPVKELIWTVQPTNLQNLITHKPLW